MPGLRCAARRPMAVMARAPSRHAHGMRRGVGAIARCSSDSNFCPLSPSHSAEANLLLAVAAARAPRSAARAPHTAWSPFSLSLPPLCLCLCLYLCLNTVLCVYCLDRRACTVHNITAGTVDRLARPMDDKTPHTSSVLIAAEGIPLWPVYISCSLSNGMNLKLVVGGHLTVSIQQRNIP